MNAPDPSSTPARSVPERPSLDGLEAKWDAAWEHEGTYRFDRTKARADVYAIDTPPPTVSGSLHLGTVFGYVQFDSIARFWRMRGKEVFFPVGWDDNGLPTERRVQNHYGVRCDPTLAYDRGRHARARGRRPPAGRPPKLHRALPGADRRGRADLRAGVPGRRAVRRLGADLHHHQRALAPDGPARLPAQPGPGRGLRRARPRRCGTSTSRRRWPRPRWRTGRRPAPITSCRSTGRQEETSRSTRRAPSCWRPAWRSSSTPTTPAGATSWARRSRPPSSASRVPVVTHHLADPEKGTGAAMICTFGDATDVVWWRELDLPTRSVVRRDGRFQAERPDWLTTEQAASAPGRPWPARPPRPRATGSSSSWRRRASSSASPARSRTRSATTSGATARSRS